MNLEKIREDSLIFMGQKKPVGLFRNKLKRTCSLQEFKKFLHHSKTIKVFEGKLGLQTKKYKGL